MMELKVIAHIQTDFPDKFGIPRQSGTQGVQGKVVFLPPYGNPDAVRGLADYSHLWLLWGFSANRPAEAFAPTVRPPRLGGNKRMGVWATRSPNRPNPIGLSVVRLVQIDKQNGSVELLVEGVDMADGTPIYDIKPYLPYADCIADAKGGFGGEHSDESLQVVFACDVPADCAALAGVLSQDPRPHYQQDGRLYGMRYRDYEVKFAVQNDTLTVLSVQRREQ